jgi:hypothetical protein
MDRPDQPTAHDASIKVTSCEKRPEIYSSPEASSKKGQRNSLALSPTGNKRSIPESDEKKMTLPQTESMLTDASRMDEATAADIFSGIAREGSLLNTGIFFGRRSDATIITDII